jgi:hypothetical protein
MAILASKFCGSFAGDDWAVTGEERVNADEITIPNIAIVLIKFKIIS